MRMRDLFSQTSITITFRIHKYNLQIYSCELKPKSHISKEHTYMYVYLLYDAQKNSNSPYWLGSALCGEKDNSACMHA